MKLKNLYYFYTPFITRNSIWARNLKNYHPQLNRIGLQHLIAFQRVWKNKIMVTTFLNVASELLLVNFRLDHQVTEWTLEHQKLDIQICFPFLHELVSKDAFHSFLISNNVCLDNPLLTQGTETTALIAELRYIVIWAVRLELQVYRC